jgi:HEAT repeat protein
LSVPPLLRQLGETTRKTVERDRFAHRRAVAARLVVLLRDEQATKPLVKALRDEYDVVRQQAAAALARVATPDTREPLADYLHPLLEVLQGRYVCYVRLDSEGRVLRTASRDGLVYGPFVVQVRPQSEASPADLERQRDSALAIEKKEEARLKEIQANIEQGKQGRVVRAVRAPIGLSITPGGVTLARTGLELKDPAAASQVFSVIEGESAELKVDIKNAGPGDLVTDFFVAVYCGSPKPRNNVDRPESGEFVGERARDLRGLLVPFEKRHVRSMYHQDVRETPYDDTTDSVVLTVHFDTVEADRIEALRRLVDIGDESAIPALGKALGDRSYTVRRQAAIGLGRVLEAAHTTATGRAEIVKLMREVGLKSTDAVVRCQSAEALRVASDGGTAEDLQALLLRDQDPTVRMVAVRALAGLPPAERRRVLPSLLGADTALRQMVPRLLQDDADRPVARQCLNSGDPLVAREALRSAGRLLETSDLTAALQSSDARVRMQAARALGQRKDAGGQTPLLAALADPDGGVRAAAAEALGALLKGGEGVDSKTIVAALVQVVNNEAGDYVGIKPGEKVEDPATAVVTDKKTRAAAVAALADVATKSSVNAVKDALKDSNPDVLAAALPAIASKRLGDQRERLSAIMGDGKLPARVRQAAALAVWQSGMKLKVAEGEAPLPAVPDLIDDLPKAAPKAASPAATAAPADKAAPKADAKAPAEKAKAEDKAAPKAEGKAAPKAEAKAEDKAPAKADEKAATSKADAPAGDKATAEAKAGDKAKAEDKAAPKAETKADAKAAPKAEDKAKAKEVTEQEKIDKTLDALVGLLNEQKESVKTGAAVALIGLGDDRGNKVLRDQLRHKNIEVRREAARLLATLPEEAAKKLPGLKAEERDPLGLLFQDLYRTGSLPVNFRFLCRAFETLGTQPRTIQRLQTALADKDHPVLRAAGVTTLAQLGDPGAKGQVLAMLGDPNEFVRSRACDVAARLGLIEAPVQERLKAMLSGKPDPSADVRVRAAEALLALAEKG